MAIILDDLTQFTFMKDGKFVNPNHFICLVCFKIHTLK